MSSNQSSSQSVEHADQVMTLPDQQNFHGDLADAKIIEKKNVVYCSNFDLNIDQWFNEYENLQIFRMNMKKNLGATCLSHFSGALEINTKNSSQEKQDLFFNQILNFYFSNYYSNALAACFKSQVYSEKMFQNFYKDMLEFLKLKQYTIKDLSTLQSLVHTFYIISLQEYQNIMKKIESDQQSQIQLTEKAMAQFEQMQRHEALIQKEKILDQQSQEQKQKKEQVTAQKENQFSQYFPGISMIKDKLIKPLLFATEKVVEYYFPEEIKHEEPQKKSQAELNNNSAKAHIGSQGNTKTTVDTLSVDSSNELSLIKRRLQKLEINSTEEVLFQPLESPNANNSTNLKKRRFRQLERQNMEDAFEQTCLSAREKDDKTERIIKSDRKSLKLNQKILRKASYTIDLISQKIKSKKQLQETVTASFVTNVYEITSDALQMNEQLLVKQQLEANRDESDDSQSFNMNLRFIKPSQKFYNKLISNWFKFTYLLEEQEKQINYSSMQEIKKAYIQFSKINALKNNEWKENQLKSLEKFAEIITYEYCNLKLTQAIDIGQISYCTFFDNVKAQLLNLWEKEIIQKSNKFQQVKTPIE